MTCTIYLTEHSRRGGLYHLQESGGTDGGGPDLGYFIVNPAKGGNQFGVFQRVQGEPNLVFHCAKDSFPETDQIAYDAALALAQKNQLILSNDGEREVILVDETRRGKASAASTAD